MKTGGTEITRFNALRHGVLSRYTVLPWENADEYWEVVEALVAEHGPQGPTEEHLVEELVGILWRIGILWRKRRLRLAEAAAHRRGLDGTLVSYRETVKVALVHLDTTGQSERVVDAIRATAADTEEDIADMTADEVMTRRALDLLGSKRNDAYEAALAALREDTRGWWRDVLAREPDADAAQRAAARRPHRVIRFAKITDEPLNVTANKTDPQVDVLGLVMRLWGSLRNRMLTLRKQ